MKLGIVVVYLVKEEDGPLLDLHLSQIEKNTRAPYTIYAGVARLLPAFRDRLSQNSKIRICDFEPVHLRSSEEHAFYLQRLINIALQDGATHIATLHVDSFPVQPGWDEMLARRLSVQCVLAGVMRDRQYDCKPNTACMFFNRDYFLGERPAFLLDDAERASHEYKGYLQTAKVIEDSGIGYGFNIYQKGLSWHPLERSNKASDHPSLGGIFGDMIFHIGSLNTDIKTCPGDAACFHSRGARGKAAYVVREAGKLLFPPHVRMSLKRNLPRTLLEQLFPEHKANKEALWKIKKSLLDDPEGYLNYLRTGQKAATSVKPAGDVC